MMYSNKLTVVLTLALFISCATGGNNNPKSLETSARNESIVIRVGAQKAVLSKYSRRFWVSISNNTKNKISQMHAALASGDASNSEILARNYLLKHPSSKDALTILAASLILQKKLKLGNYYADKILKLHNDNTVAYNIKGIATLYGAGKSLDKINKAIKYFETSYSNSGSQIAAGINLGYLYLEVGSNSKAKEIFRDVKQRCDNCEISLMGSGIASYRLKNLEQAKNAFSAVLELSPNNAYAIYRLALVYKSGMNNKKSLDLLNSLVRNEKIHDSDLKERANTTIRLISSRRKQTHKASSKQDLEDVQSLMETVDYDDKALD